MSKIIHHDKVEIMAPAIIAAALYKYRMEIL